MFKGILKQFLPNSDANVHIKVSSSVSNILDILHWILVKACQHMPTIYMWQNSEKFLVFNVQICGLFFQHIF